MMIRRNALSTHFKGCANTPQGTDNHEINTDNLLSHHFYIVIVIVIVIVISKLLKRYSKAKRTRAPAYSRALRRIKGGFPKGGQEKLRSEFQSTRRGQSSC